MNFFKFWSKNETLKPEIGDTASVWTISKLDEPNVSTVGFAWAGAKEMTSALFTLATVIVCVC